MKKQHTIERYLNMPNYESYLIDDKERHFFSSLSDFEFNLLRIHRYLYIFLKGIFEMDTKYEIKGNYIRIYQTKKIEFKTTIFSKNILFENEYINIEEEARCIRFHINNEQKIRFIPSKAYLDKVLKNLKMTSFYTSNNRNSNVSLDDTFSIFYDTTIIDIYEKSDKKILSEDNFKMKFNKYGIKKIKDLSNKSSEYFPESAEDNFVRNIYDKDYEKINYFLNSNKKVLYLFGPKKSGKSIFLKTFPYALCFEKNGYLYLNINTLKKKKNSKDIKKLIYYEMLYLINEQKQVDDLYNLKLFKDIQYINTFNYLEMFIKNFCEKFDADNFFCDNVLIIIDDLYINDEELENEAQVFDNIINNIRKKDKFKLIISGEGYFYYKKIRQFFLFKNEHYEDYFLMNRIYNEILKINKANPKKPKNKLIEEEKQFLEKFQISNLIQCKNLDGKILPFERFKNLEFTKIMPNYLLFSFPESHKEIEFSIENQIYSEALSKKVEFYIKENELKKK